MIDEEAQNDQEISHFAFRIADFGFGMCDVGCEMSNTVHRLAFIVYDFNDFKGLNDFELWLCTKH